MIQNIVRADPDIGYLGRTGNESLGMSQIVSANGFLFWSGVVAARGDYPDMEIIGLGDMRAQLDFVFDVISRCLSAADTTNERVVSLSVYTTDIVLMQSILGDILPGWSGGNRPTLTCMQIVRLGAPEFLVEVAGVAFL